LGVDAEPNEPLPTEARATIATDDELTLLRELPDGEIHWERLLFSAKESVFKAFYPLYRQWLGFQEASIRFNPEQQTFEAMLRTRSAGNGQMLWPGRFALSDRYIVTAVVLPTC
jgi:4'-phosphopantetheinyl transferase EntD